MKKIVSLVSAVGIALLSVAGVHGYVTDENGVIQCEFEDYLSENTGFSSYQTADKEGLMAGVSKISSSTYKYTIKFDIEEADEYNMQIAAAAFASDVLTNYSDVSWSLNGSEEKTLNASASFYKLDESGSPQRAMFTINDKVELLKGENTLVLSGGKRTGSPMVVFYADYVKFSPLSVPIVTPTPTPTPTPEPSPQPTPTPKPTPDGTLRLEIEDITNELIVRDANVSGGKFQIYKSPETNDLVYHFTGTVEKKGEYNLSFACADYSNMPFLSQLYFSLNGGEYVEINDTNCSRSQLEELEDSSQRATFNLYKYIYNEAVELEEGEFSIDIKAIARLNTAPGAGKFFAFDYIDVSEKKELEPVIGKEHIEIEDVSNIGITNDANVSGGKFQIYKTPNTDPIVQTFKFDIEENGDYTINIAAATFAKMSYLSQLYISINGSKFVELNDSNFYITQLEELADTGLRSTYNLYSHIYKNDVSLRKGITTIEIKATTRTNTNASPGVYFALDYIEVMPVKSLKGLCGKVDNGFVECGKDAQLKIFNEENKQLNDADISNIKYTIADKNIASIDEKGLIHARNYGTAKIHVELDRKGDKADFEYTLYVTDKCGVYLLNAKRNDNTISFDVNALKDSNSDYQVIVVVYGYEDGYYTSIKKTYRVDVGNLFAGTKKTFTQKTDAQSNDKISLYLISTYSNEKALYSKIEL